MTRTSSGPGRWLIGLAQIYRVLYIVVHCQWPLYVLSVHRLSLGAFVVLTSSKGVEALMFKPGRLLDHFDHTTKHAFNRALNDPVKASPIFILFEKNLLLLWSDMCFMPI